MELPAQLEEAIIEFDEWQTPWIFHRTVLQSPLLDEQGRAAFEKLWASASESSAWREALDLSAACEEVSASLRTAFPSAQTSTIRGVVRAQSYEWR